MRADAAASLPSRTSRSSSPPTVSAARTSAACARRASRSDARMRARPNAGGAWSQQRSSSASSSARSGRSSHSQSVPRPVSPSTSARSSSVACSGGALGRPVLGLVDQAQPDGTQRQALAQLAREGVRDVRDVAQREQASQHLRCRRARAPAPRRRARAPRRPRARAVPPRPAIRAARRPPRTGPPAREVASDERRRARAAGRRSAPLTTMPASASAVEMPSRAPCCIGLDHCDLAAADGPYPYAVDQEVEAMASLVDARLGDLGELVSPSRSGAAGAARRAALAAACPRPPSTTLVDVADERDVRGA